MLPWFLAAISHNTISNGYMPDWVRTAAWSKTAQDDNWGNNVKCGVKFISYGDTFNFKEIKECIRDQSDAKNLSKLAKIYLFDLNHIESECFDYIGKHYILSAVTFIVEKL